MEKDVKTGDALEVLASPEKRIPKYCTNVILQKMSNGHIVLSFTVKDTPQDIIDGGVLIERIMIDHEHAGQIAKIINDAIEEKHRLK